MIIQVYQMNTASFIVIIFTGLKEAEWMTILLTFLKALIVVKEIDIDLFDATFSALRWVFW